MKLPQVSARSGFKRVLGDFGGASGPTVVAIGGVHGNEPAGVFALQRVVETLGSAAHELRGRFVAVAANLAALQCDERYLARDLNRIWTRDRVARLRSGSLDNETPEDHEQNELYSLFEALCGDAEGPMVFLDLHTSSAEGPPFCCLGDTFPGRRIADSLGVPMILGIEQCIEGSLMEFFGLSGRLAIAVEGGQHASPDTVDRLEASVWVLLHACGVYTGADLEAHRSRLRSRTNGLPRLVEVLDLQPTTPGFVMKPGYVNFQLVQRDEVLAHDDRGELRASRSAHILLPLYQGQGDDGFFLAREIGPARSFFSWLLRRLGLGGLVHLLPGVRKVDWDPYTVAVDPRIARVYVVSFFHLVGYRFRSKKDGLLYFQRRWVTRDTRKLGRR